MANISSFYVHRVLFYLIFLYKAYALVCPQNEVEVTCPSSCPSDNCPTGPRQTQFCPKFSTDICRASACKCRFNFSRARNGTCIPTRECPPFRCPNVHEVYNPCPPACPTDDCSQATPTGRCPIIGRIGIVVPCKPDCRCKKNYWRKNGICVPYARCNRKNASSIAISSGHVTSTFTYTDTDSKGAKAYSYAHASSGFAECGTNEIHQSCKKSCPPDTCISLVAKFKCDSEALCTSGCICKPSFLRKSAKGPCIPIRECPQLANSPDFN